MKKIYCYNIDASKETKEQNIHHFIALILLSLIEL